MFKYHEKYIQRDQEVEETLKEVFNFKNKKAQVLINDVNYWTFGEVEEKIPEDYYTNPKTMMDYQESKIKRHYEYYLDKNEQYIGFLHPWYGTSVLASGFGTNVIYNPKQDPAVDISKIQKIEEIKKLELPNPYKDGQMPQVLKTIDYFKENSVLPIGITDCQGPLTTAFSVAGYDKFIYWMYDYPNIIHEFMEKITYALIEWIKVQKKHAGVSMESHSYPLGVKVPDGFGGVWLSDDDSVLMSADLYKEFVKPYNEKVLEAFGGGVIHYCGNSNQNIESYANTKYLTGIHNMNLDDIKGAMKMKAALHKKGIVYMAGDFAPKNERLDGYYSELIQTLGDQAGLIIVPYVAPAISLDNGKYELDKREQFKVGKEIFNIIENKLN